MTETKSITTTVLKKYLEEVKGFQNLESDGFLGSLDPHNNWLFMHSRGVNDSDGVGVIYAYGKPTFLDLATGEDIELKDVEVVIHIEALDGESLIGWQLDSESLRVEEDMAKLLEIVSNSQDLPIRLNSFLDGGVLVKGQPLSEDDIEVLKNYGTAV